MLPVLLTDSVTSNLSRAVHYALLWGMEGVVLRTVGTSESRVPFVNEPQLRARLADAEMPVAAVDPGLFEGHLGEKVAWMNDQLLVSDVAEFCTRIKCQTILTGAVAGSGLEFDEGAAANVLAEAAEIAHRFGVTLAVRNDAASTCASGESLARVVAAANHPAVTAAWSPADALQAGFSPGDGLQALIETGRIGMVMVRDGENTGPAWADKAPGEGAVGWAQQIEILAGNGFAGAVCIDIRGEAPAQHGLAHATGLLRLIKSTRANARRGT